MSLVWDTHDGWCWDENTQDGGETVETDLGREVVENALVARIRELEQKIAKDANFTRLGRALAAAAKQVED